MKQENLSEEQHFLRALAAIRGSSKKEANKTALRLSYLVFQVGGFAPMVKVYDPKEEEWVQVVIV